MLYAIVAKPGQGKTYFAVTLMDKQQRLNNFNVKKNVQLYYENKQLLEERDLLNKSFTYTYEIGEKEIERTSKHADFDQFEDEEQFEEYFELAFYYNHYIAQIAKSEGIKLTKLLPVRQIYSDINGLKIKYVIFCDTDWRVTPMGSIHFIDEIRRKPPYNWQGRNPSNDPIIKGMSEVRHTDKDVWLITQDAEDYNYSLRQLIDKLYFVKRPPQNPQACGVYVFDQFLSRPRAAADSKRDPKKYVEHFTLMYKKKYFDMYTSASSHTSMKFRINWKVFAYLFLFICIVLIVIVGFLNIPIFKYFGSAISQMTGQEKNSLAQIKDGQSKTASDPTATTATTDNPNGFDPNIECRKGINVEKPICVQWFDDQSKKQASNNNVQQVSYNPNDPYNNEDIQKAILYDVTQKPVFSGCMKQGSKYIAYTQQGTKLDVSSEDCRKLIDNGDRPFNYFKTQDIQPMQQASQQPQQFIQNDGNNPNYMNNRNL